MLAPPEMTNSLAGALIFIGSFAPVFFFFVTGVGSGIQAGQPSQKQTPGRWLNVLFKVAILFWADLLMHWSSGSWIGLDFLGFIGLSVLVLEIVRQSKYPLAFAVSSIVLISGLRYVVGPRLAASGYDPSWPFFDWLIGTTAVPNVSYPFAPWMVYPLLGYLLGFAAVHYRNLIEKRPSRIVSGLVVAGAFPSILGLILAQRGATFFRWGTMSIGFYIISFAAVLFGVALSFVVCGGKQFKILQTALSLRGVASLAVVPVHYFLIGFLADTVGLKQLNSFTYGLICTAILVASFMLARAIERLSQKIHQINKQKLLWFGLVSILLLASGVTLAYGGKNEFVVMSSRTIGQTILCLLLTVRLPGR